MNNTNTMQTSVGRGGGELIGLMLYEALQSLWL